jgi:putative ABC transport system permease protein
MVNRTPAEAPRSTGVWLRWSWRDLRHHWVSVVVIALVMAIGVGVYAGLGSTSTWRRVSNDESFAALDMHDLQVTLSPGTFIDEGALVAAVDGLADPGVVVQASERLVVDSQIDASTDTDAILVVARIVGMDITSGDAVDDLWVTDGRTPTAGSAAGVLEAQFADHWNLPTDGVITVGGNRTVEYVGLGTSPEDFFYEGPEGSIFSAGDLAPLYLPLSSAQDIVGQPGNVNDLVLTLADGADRDAVQAQLSAAVGQLGVSATVSTREDAVAYRVLYEDIDNDQQFWNMLAGLVLVAAAIAAFNLVSRIVEAQRREIGIGMALGVARSKLAIRPLLVGVQVGVLGTIAGVGVGLLVGQAMANLFESVRPLPIYRTPFQFSVFARAALLALLIPIVASAIPVWRAVRVEPIEAIRTGHLTAKTSRLTDLTGRWKLPGSSLTQMPIRNFLRTPRRTVLTAVGVGAAIAALVAVFGLLDSFGRTIDQTGNELTKGNADRVLVQLDTFYPVDSDVVTAIAEAPAVGATDAGLRLPVTAIAANDAEDLDLLVEIVDLDNAMWTPTIERSNGAPEAGIVLASKAADDLGVSLGDTMTLQHPTQVDAGSFALIESDFTVTGIHANPLRTFAFLDIDQADRFGLRGAANIVHATPATGSDRGDVQRALFELEGVTSSQAVAQISEAFDSALDQLVGFLIITAAAVLALALLMAFNATRISVDERRREHATMRAFGVPVRSIMGVVVKEGVLVGVLATLIGLATGFLFLQVMLRSLATTTLPDLAIDSYISPTTIIIAVIVGIVAVSVAPLFLTRRISSMDIPDTLRVME